MHLKAVCLSILFLMLGHSFKSHANKLPNNLAAYQAKFAHTLLVVHFNHPFYGNIEFIKKLYSPILPNIVFYGEKAHPEIHVVETHYGYLFTRVMADAMRRYPQYEGYLFLQDDCIINIWNCYTLDSNKIWYAVRFNADRNTVPSPSEKFELALDISQDHIPTDWDWWASNWGVVPAREAIGNLTSTQRVFLEKNAGRNRIVGCVCDMFYVPQRFRNQVISLALNFKDIFCEIAVPTLLCCLDPISNWEQLKMLWTFALDPYPAQFTWIHPIKLSQPSNRAQLLRIFNVYLGR